MHTTCANIALIITSPFGILHYRRSNDSLMIMVTSGTILLCSPITVISEDGAGRSLRPMKFPVKSTGKHINNRGIMSSIRAIHKKTPYPCTHVIMHRKLPPDGHLGGIQCFFLPLPRSRAQSIRPNSSHSFIP